MMKLGHEITHLFQSLIVQLEEPEMEPSLQLGDGAQSEEELLSRAQGDVRVCHLGLEDLRLLLFCWDHALQDFLQQGETKGEKHC